MCVYCYIAAVVLASEWILRSRQKLNFRIKFEDLKVMAMKVNTLSFIWYSEECYRFYDRRYLHVRRMNMASACFSVMSVSFY